MTLGSNTGVLWHAELDMDTRIVKFRFQRTNWWFEGTISEVDKSISGDVVLPPGGTFNMEYVSSD